MNSLQEISDKLQLFADKHANINQYVMGDFTTFNSNDNKYPLIWATPTRIRFIEGKLVYVINIAIMNIVYDGDDMIKILSDQAVTLGDLLSYITDDSDNERYFISLKDVSEAQPFFGGIDDVCGWSCDISFTVGHSYNSLAINFK